MVGGDAEGVAGTVVEPGQNLGVPARLAVGSGERVVGEVGLPTLVGKIRLEACVGGLGSLAGVGKDEAVTGEIAADGGGGEAYLVLMQEVPGDGLGAGIEALVDEPMSE